MTIVAALSMLAGNLPALLQENMTRILGYSSISQLGNILFVILAAGVIGRMAAVFYIVTYAVTAIAALAICGSLILLFGVDPQLLIGLLQVIF